MSKFTSHQPPFAHAGVPRFLITKQDRINAEAIQWICTQVFPAGDMKICTSGMDAGALLQREPFDFILLGLNFPDIDGLKLVQQVCKLRLNSRLIVVAERRDEPLLSGLHSAPVNAIIDLAADSTNDFKQALRLVHAGEVYIRPTLRSLLVERNPVHDVRQELSRAEIRVLRVIGAGHDNQEAARFLGLSEATIQTHRRNIMRKLKGTNTVSF
ncbi:MAG: response regulator transcription factor [Cephaloticoccus sp.]|nr:response regulator transcription factor [Cephaloticoccus sp.]MCF7761729.1 response regulator transcription factor [Cephaloticoccus sp.]